jgi:alpha-1,2-mannosyltransferase
VLTWHDSVRYWTAIIFETARIGSPAEAANQSIQAVLARAGLPPQTLAGAAVWLALSAAVLATASRGMRHALAVSDTPWALSLNALAALLVSPISWSHHWVWIAPALLSLAASGYRRRARLLLITAACGFLIFGASPEWWFPSAHGQELRWAFWQQAVASSYVLFAALVLLLAAGAKPSVIRPGPHRFNPVGEINEHPGRRSL